ncbi:Gfo/Idh/MocA family protein [Sporolactobacillus spathodeae]|uniref:Dehydrogenase n=1 Tax=Sporolactobacillus spathodeae TaxID=1465502 RepID=A0ABS2Q6Q8_9BACL|nr:Gfo/Idh/MocA family oxidoreductase [Sporolactobacillus spathodeae]MBM7657488.1 putative dehydrogenase [Sporolactobacillus spathodeae]
MKLATIGTSKITESFLRSVAATGRMTFVGAYSRSEEKARAFAQKNGGQLWFSSLEALAGSPDVDVVYIASPNTLHHRQVCQMLAGGKHVICEKPIVVTRKEFDEAFRLADEQGVFLFEAIRNIQTPVFKTLQANLAQAGQIRSAVLELVQYSSRYDSFLKGTITNIFSPEFAGGALEDLGVYTIYPVIALFGSPLEAHYYPVKLSNGIDGSGTLILRYDQFVCTLLCSKIAHSSAPSEIHGEKGTWRINNPSDIHQLEWIDAHTKEVQPVASCCVPDDKVFEIANFADIIARHDQGAYEHLKQLSSNVLSVMEHVRKENGIIFPNDEQ